MAFRKAVDRIWETQKSHEKDAQRKAFLQWLSNLDYRAQQKDTFSRRQPGTGEWFINEQHFKEWVAQSFMTLFCPGIPGAGKTMISAIIIHHLESEFMDDPDVGIAYIYCTYQAKREEQKPNILVLSLVKQLLQQRGDIPADILEVYTTLVQKSGGLSLNESTTMLKLAIKHFSKVHIVLDALDEYYVSDRDDCTTFVAEILEIQREVQFGLLATSRSIAEISSLFADAHSIEIRAQEADITKYIDIEISKLRCSLSNQTSLQDDIRREILRASDGM
jgi:hypothetical protein